MTGDDERGHNGLGEGDDFARRLERARAEREGAERTRDSFAERESKSAMGFAFRVGIELVSALVVGVGIGYLLDRWLGTAPWLLIVFFFIGAGAGMMNVYRTVSGMGYAVGYRAARQGDKPTDGRRPRGE